MTGPDRFADGDSRDNRRAPDGDETQLISPDIRAGRSDSARATVPDSTSSPYRAASGSSPWGSAAAYSTEPTRAFEPAPAPSTNTPPPTAQYPAVQGSFPSSGVASFPTPGAGPSADGLPPYAPATYPAAYAPGPVSVGPPPAAPAPTGSRALAGVFSALIGMVLTAAGLFLLFRYGDRVLQAYGVEGQSAPLRDVLLTLGGAVLIGVVLALTGWSPWATLLPGLALTAIGGWALFSSSLLTRLSSALHPVYPDSDFARACANGVVLALGLTMLGASLAVSVARAAGRRAGLAARPS